MALKTSFTCLNVLRWSLLPLRAKLTEQWIVPQVSGCDGWERAQVCAILASVKNVPSSFAFSPQLLSLILLVPTGQSSNKVLSASSFSGDDQICSWTRKEEQKDPDCYGKQETTWRSCNDSSQACLFLASLPSVETSIYQRGLRMFSI